MMTGRLEFNLQCPALIREYPRILLAHGGGGSMMQRLINELFLPAFAGTASNAPDVQGLPARLKSGLSAPHDGFVFELGGERLAFTTDSFVVQPLFFPGGDIGSLAVNGTVNDLAMCGARPLFLSAGFIIEEGLPLETLARVVESMRDTAAAAGVAIVTGDTKVVDQGKGDGLFINTAGIGLIGRDTPRIHPASVQAGDSVIVSGDLGRHGMAVMARREGLEFESEICSDCAPLQRLVTALFESGIEVHCLRDLTRGGLAAALNEIAAAANLNIQIAESAIPVNEDVRGACEIIGLDPLYVANEGRFVAFVPERDAAAAVDVLNRLQTGTRAARIGAAAPARPRPQVTIASAIGVNRILDLLSGEQLPRIC